VRTASTPPVTEDLAAQAEQLRLALARTARRLRQEAGGDLGPTLIAALGTIARHGPLTPSELAARERIQRPTATRLVAKLVDRGLVARTAAPDDARSCLLSTTPAGAEHLAAVRTRKDAFLTRRLAELAPADRATLTRAATLLEELLEGGEPS
jgi:DNA-binding MarR family transcriptional regulator